MRKTMKNIILTAVLCLGLAAFGSEKAEATDYQTSTFTWVWVSSGTAIDLTKVQVSTGWNNGQFFWCADSNTFVQNGGVGGVVLFSSFTTNQLLFPPIAFLPSTATVTGQPLLVDFANTYNGGITAKNGIVCGVDGPDTTRNGAGVSNTSTYRYSIYTEATPSQRGR